MATKDYEIVLHYRLKVVADDTIQKDVIADHFEGIFSSMTPYNTDLKFKVTDIIEDGHCKAVNDWSEELNKELIGNITE
jgi:hypothetical protein